MHHSFTAIGFAALVLVAGCTMPASAPSVIGANTGPVGGTCNAQGAQGIVGQNSTAKTVEDARIRSGAMMARVRHPGQIVTKEFNAQRLSLDVDANGRILTARCG